MKSKHSAEKNRDSVSLDFSTTRLIEEDSTPPAWKEFVSCLFLVCFVLFFTLEVSVIWEERSGNEVKLRQRYMLVIRTCKSVSLCVVF